MKIVVRLPHDLKAKMLYFPFLQCWVRNYLKQKSDDDILVIHFMSTKESLDALNLFPFNAYYHQLTIADCQNIFSIHRYAKSLNLKSIDVYLSLTLSFLDAQLGLALGAKKRIGFSDSAGQFFFNEKITSLQGRHPSEQLLSLYERFDLPLTDNSLTPVTSRRLEWEHNGLEKRKYWVFNLSLDLTGEIDNEWADFLDLFEQETFVLLCADLDVAYQKEKLKDFIEKLSPKNQYIIFEKYGHIDFAKLVSSCRAFVGFDTDLVYLAAYCAPKVFYIKDKADFNQSDFTYFLSEVKVFNLNEPLYGGRISKAFDEVIDYINSVKDEEL